MDVAAVPVRRLAPRASVSRWAAPAVLLVLLAVVYAWTMRPGHDWGGDFSVYIAEARNIVSGAPYSTSAYVVTPESAVHMPAGYPPAFPLLLAPLYAEFGLDYVVFKALVGAMLLLACGMFYLVGRLRGLPPLGSAVAAGIFGLSGAALVIKESVVSDTTYLFFSGAALALILHVYRRGLDKTKPVLSGAGAGALLLASDASRAIGLSLVLAFALYELYKARRIRLFPVTAGVVFVAGYAAMAALVYDARSYGNQFWFDPHAYISNAEVYFKATAQIWAASPTPLRYALALVTLGLAALGWARAVRSRLSIVEIYAVTALIPVLLYTAGATPRYVLPLFPIATIFAVEAVLAIVGRVPAAMRRPALASSLTVAVLGCALNVHAAPRGPELEGVSRPSFIALCQFVEHDATRGPIVFFNPRVLALYTNHASAWYPFTRDHVQFLRYLRRIHAAYVAVYANDADDRDWVEPHVRALAADFVPVYRNTEFTVYRVQ